MNSALLVMDYQMSLFVRHGTDEVLDAAVAAVAAARRHEVPVVFVRVGFRLGVPEAVARNVLFANGSDGLDATEGVLADFGLTARDLVVTKRRVGAFVGTDLELLLRALDVTHLVLAGLSTGGVVLSTVRAAADLDFSITVLADACSDADQKAHHLLLEHIFPRQAKVLSVDDWVTSLTYQQSANNPLA